MLRYNLIDLIMRYSDASTFEEAVSQWTITRSAIDHSCKSECVCGKENIKYLFEIYNPVTGATLFPIGSRCIRKFEDKYLNEQVSVYEQLAVLYEAISEGSFLSLKSGLFSRKLIKFLYDRGAFTPNAYNKNNPVLDYQFLLDMFNKKTEPTPAQKKKIAAIILAQIKPFLVENIDCI